VKQQQATRKSTFRLHLYIGNWSYQHDYPGNGPQRESEMDVCIGCRGIAIGYERIREHGRSTAPPPNAMSCSRVASMFWLEVVLTKSKGWSWEWVFTDQCVWMCRTMLVIRLEGVLVKAWRYVNSLKMQWLTCLCVVERWKPNGCKLWNREVGWWKIWM
jgi:hypothetical protein